jgi:imidazolonepropionase-like amidohydrolase
MDLPDDLGQIRAGFLADLILVDGKPLADVKVLLDRDRILAVMKDGAFHRRGETGLRPRF